MSWTNLHTHCYFCDGNEHPEVFIEKALDLNMDAVGFSSHAPLPFPSTWAMKIHKLGEYLNLIQKLKKKYEEKLPVFLGLETDFIPRVTGPSSFTSRYVLDYVIGSVHYAGHSKDIGYWTVDCNPGRFKSGLDVLFHGNCRLAAEEFYRRIRQMVETDPPDMIGHLDLIKKNNPDELYFSEDETWYKDAVDQTLETIAKSRCIVEVNTGGITRGYTTTFYPGPWILKRCFDLGIPVTISSDSHHPDTLLSEFPSVVETLSIIGYKTIRTLKDSGSWIDIPICDPISKFPEANPDFIDKINSRS